MGLELALDRYLEQRRAGQGEFALDAHADPAAIHRLDTQSKGRRGIVVVSCAASVGWVDRRGQDEPILFEPWSRLQTLRQISVRPGGRSCYRIPHVAQFLGTPRGKSRLVSG